GADTNRLSFSLTLPPGDPTGRAWSSGQATTLQTFLTQLEPVLLRIYGPPAFNLQVTVIHDPSLNSIDMAAYDASSNQIRLELLNDVDATNPTQTAIDPYDLYVLTFAVLKAYHDDALLRYDAWEDGMVRAAQLLAISEVRPDFGFLARDFNLLFSAYDVLNQPGLESPSFRGVEGGGEADTMRDALASIRVYLAQAAWLKVYAENPEVFARFNDLYYTRLAADSNVAGNVPILKNLVRSVAPTVEGLDFHDWYRRQHVLDTSVVPGAKLYVFNIPQKDFITGEPTNSLPMNVYHFEVTPSNQQNPLTGTVHFTYTAYDGFDLTPAVEGASGEAGTVAEIGAAGNPAGIGSAVPLFFNIAGDQQVQMQRIEVEAEVNGMTRQIWFPNDVAADDNQARNHVYGLVTNGFQGELEIAIEGRDVITTNVIQGAFKAKVPGGLPVPAKATFSFTPDSSGGSRVDATEKNVMFLGPIGSGVDTATGDAVVILQTPPETMRQLQQTIPAGLSMVTIPAFALRTNAAEVLGVPASQLLMARADQAVPTFEPYRMGSIYRLWPNTPAFRPGYAYWVQTAAPLTLNFEGVEANRDRPFPQHYPPGWAQIGNPWTDLNIQLQALRVQPTDGSGVLTLAEAQSRGIVSSGVFRYNRQSAGYELLTPSSVLNPYEGYWLNILDERGATLIYPNAVSGAGRAAGRGRAGDPNRWRVNLVATSEGYRDAAASLGVEPGASDGYSLQDIAKPPYFGSFVSVAFPAPAGSRQSGPYAVDLREGNGISKSWEVVVESNAGPRQVTLSWPDVAAVPAGVDLVLTDLETGRSRFLRSTSSYTFDLGASGARRLRISAERGSQAGLAVTSLEVRGGRGTARSISYSLTSPAEVTVSLNSQSGRLLRTLASGRASGRGVNDIPFLATDSQGRPLPRGIYRLDLIAVGSDGRQVRTSRLVRVEN
ncbi:MAG: hypothetical protein HUU35_06335, partial [Armatimonadetes bacterium]|nr:hypothetical protein [Armatimonadota bacterium]